MNLDEMQLLKSLFENPQLPNASVFKTVYIYLPSNLSI